MILKINAANKRFREFSFASSTLSFIQLAVWIGEKCIVFYFNLKRNMYDLIGVQGSHVVPTSDFFYSSIDLIF